MNLHSLPSKLQHWWSHLPFKHMTTLVITLLIIGDQFPFSNFPMYSNFGTDADVMFVTDQNNNPITMKPLLKTSSSSTKKRYKKELSNLCKKSGHDIEQATTTQRQQAGSTTLQSLIDDLDPQHLPPHVTQLRLHLRTFEFDRKTDHVIEHPAEHLASQTLPTTPTTNS